MKIFPFSCILLLTLSFPILWNIHWLLAILVVLLYFGQDPSQPAFGEQ
ncbi:MAG: hypothetical protein KatS3mg023_2811 [Armatimonadota bacterium]|nr:MAG: hypothetical protein KatS3mg023_2811 [Armatimonadota bacterium]